MSCDHFRPAPISRREMLKQVSNGFGSVAFASMFGSQLLAEQTETIQKNSRKGLTDFVDPKSAGNPFAVRKTHFPAKVKNVIFLYMDGGVSQVDTFDPKPALDKIDGKKYPAKIEPTQFNNIGTALKSPWKFKKYGQSGIPVSSLFPHVAKHVDDLAIVRSMTSEFPEHTNANYFLHTGSGLQGRPSMGAWATYGLGSECHNLPGFIVLNGGLIPPGGLDNLGSGFLPASYQASIFQSSNPPVANINRREKTKQLQENKLKLIQQLDRTAAQKFGQNQQIESAISNYELAAQMQLAVPGLMDLSKETKQTQNAYGLSDKKTATFGRNCLLARRLVERGVRFIELTCPGGSGDRWDQHSKLREGHSKNAYAVDKPIGALLQDLKQRGLFDETLVVWSGEFGRTPFAQGKNGRDHNPFAFSIWLAGGGIKGGTIYGETDEFGYKAIRDRVEMHDLHATILHLLGMDHKQLTFRYSGRDMRLTDVHGNLIKGILK